LTVTVSPQAAAGNYTVTVTGTSGQIVKAASATVIVPSAPQPDFSISLDPSTVTTSLGTKVPVTVNIARTGGFTGAVTITPPDPDNGVRPKPPDPMTTTDPSVTYKIKVGGGATTGQHQLTFTGTDSSGRTRTAVLTVNAQ